MTINTDASTNSLTISGTIDIDSAEALREALFGLRNLDTAEANLSDVDYCDTAALQVLLAAHADGVSSRKPFRLRCSAAIAETAEALGFDLSAPGVSA